MNDGRYTLQPPGYFSVGRAY